MGVARVFHADPLGDAPISGSSPNSGEGGADCQEEVVVISEAVRHPFDDFDLVVDSFEQAGV